MIVMMQFVCLFVSECLSVWVCVCACVCGCVCLYECVENSTTQKSHLNLSQTQNPSTKEKRANISLLSRGHVIVLVGTVNYRANNKQKTSGK